MNIERQITEVGDQYRREGYRVKPASSCERCPAVRQWPESGLDRIRRDRECSRIREGESRGPARRSGSGNLIAIGKRPRWLAIRSGRAFNSDPPAYKVPAEAREPTAERIEENLANAERLSNAGDLALSCVASWAALEAAMRRTARTVGLELKSASPRYLVGALYSNEYLQRDEYNQLYEAMKVRNALAHGMTIPSVDPTVPKTFRTWARRLLIGRDALKLNSQFNLRWLAF